MKNIHFYEIEKYSPEKKISFMKLINIELHEIEN